MRVAGEMRKPGFASRIKIPMQVSEQALFRHLGRFRRAAGILSKWLSAPCRLLAGRIPTCQDAVILLGVTADIVGAL